MTDTVLDPTRDQLPRFSIRRTRDKRALDAALNEDRAYAAYALGHLEDELFCHSTFWIAEGSTGSGVVLHSQAMGQTLFVGGDPTAVDAILSLHPGPRFTYLTTSSPDHEEVIRRSHTLADGLHMARMAVTRASFEAVQGSVRRLRGPNVRELNALYASEAAGYYSSAHIERGVYFGAYRDGRMVAAAGTHIVAPNVGVAVVGNVFTDPGYRGQGLATLVTSHVTDDLLNRGCSLVALTVDPTNTPAVRAYSRLGYERGSTVIEARARRRDFLGVGAWFRRRMARRGTHRGEAQERATGRPPRTGPKHNPNDKGAHV